ncbi:B12-binding domain-containing radical SAM protein [Candidatus Poribacteria bacterium]|nr:B12-binding domain-containing radical SAM protein [Candidatus Poribacteria bacterium]
MRVAFVSMSGVRIYSPELVALGVTLPGFVQRGEVIASLPSLAGITLAALTPSDVEFHYFEVDDIARHDILADYDLVAFSTFTAMAYECYALADRYRAQGTPVVIGGLHATLVPEEAALHADAVCVGEGESQWGSILEDARRGTLRRFYREDLPGTYDLSQTPPPRYDLLDTERYNRLTVQTSRGCPRDCEFCAASKVFGRYRVKPVEQVMREIDAIQSVWDLPFIELADDNTFVNRDWAKRFLHEMGKRDIHWFTETDVSVADDPELLDLLAESGCQQVLIGLESVSPGSFVNLDRGDWKRRRLDGYRRAIDAIQSRGVTVNGCFIVGLDGDTPDTFERIRDFVLDSNLLECQITVLTPFPGTRLYRRLQAEGRLLAESYWDRCTLFDITFAPKQMSVRDLEEGLHFLFRELYSEPVTLRRKRHYIDIQKRLTARAS